MLHRSFALLAWLLVGFCLVLAAYGVPPAGADDKGFAVVRIGESITSIEEIQSNHPAWSVRETRAATQEVLTISNSHPSQDIEFMASNGRTFVVRSGDTIDFPCRMIPGLLDFRESDGAGVLRIQVDCGRAIHLSAAG